MTWVRRTERSSGHDCAPPTRQLSYPVPFSETILGVPDVVGRRGDLWRCDDCRRLWRVGLACGDCDTYGSRLHRGMHDAGLEWRRASLWQRIRHRR